MIEEFTLSQVDPGTMPLTYSDFFDAMIKNGYPKAKEVYVDYATKTGERAYCSLGQASMNLCGSIDLGARVHGSGAEGRLVWKFVSFLNDDTDLTPQDIGKLARKVFSEILDTGIMRDTSDSV